MNQLFRRLNIRKLHRFVIHIVMMCFMCATVQPQLLFAQAADTEDFEAPTINLDMVSSGTLGEPQLFSVSAVDNIGVKVVSLFYRFNETEDFQEVAMKAIAVDEYSVSIPTADISASSIQYYIQAEDDTGNRALKGYNFDPLERSLKPSNLLATSSEPPPQKKSRTLYYVLGALAVIALGAAAAGGGSGGGDDGGSASSCDASGCQVSLVVSTP